MSDQLAALTRLCEEKDREIARMARDTARLDWFSSHAERIGIRWVGCFDLRDAIDAAMESGAGAQKGRK